MTCLSPLCWVGPVGGWELGISHQFGVSLKLTGGRKPWSQDRTLAATPLLSWFISLDLTAAWLLRMPIFPTHRRLNYCTCLVL